MLSNERLSNYARMALAFGTNAADWQASCLESYRSFAGEFQTFSSFTCILCTFATFRLRSHVISLFRLRRRHLALPCAGHHRRIFVNRVWRPHT
jgi:hypothetical protein